MKLEDVDEARASWMKLEMVCIQLCQGAVSAWCTDKPYIVDSVPDHMVVVAFQKLAAFIPVVVQKPLLYNSTYTLIIDSDELTSHLPSSAWLNKALITIDTNPSLVPACGLYNGSPDVRPVEGASEVVGKVISKGDYVVFESTVYPGLTEE